MNLIFFGAPGSGKGTYASRVGEHLGIPHISTGDLFRAEIEKETDVGKSVKERMNKGILIDDKTTVEIFRQRIHKEDCKNGFILDGFPRTTEQVKELEKITQIDLVVNFLLDEEIIIEKTMGRRVCKNCGTTYNVADIKRDGMHFPPLLPKEDGICDKCGGGIVQRTDDNAKTIKERQETYRNQSEPLLSYYREKKLVVDIDVIGSPVVMVPIIVDAIKKSITAK